MTVTPSDADAGFALVELLNAGWRVHCWTQSDREVGPEGYCVVTIFRGTEAHSFARVFHVQALVDAYQEVSQ